MPEMLKVINIIDVTTRNHSGWNVYVDKTLLDDVHKMEQDIAEMKCAEGHVVSLLWVYNIGEAYFEIFSPERDVSSETGMSCY